jgi:hypothetical protein
MKRKKLFDCYDCIYHEAYDKMCSLHNHPVDILDRKCDDFILRGSLK